MAAFLLLLVTWLGWGIAYPVTGVAFQAFDIMTLRCVVQTIGALMLLGQATIAGYGLRIGREAWFDLVVSGLLNMAIFPVCMTYGIYLMSPGRTSVLVYTMPIWATLFARLMLGEPLTANRIAAIVLGAAAVAAMVSQDLSHLQNAPLGAALTLVSAMAFGLGTVWLKRRRWRADPSVVAFWQLVIGLVPLYAAWLIWGGPLDLAKIGPAQIAAVAFLGIIANGAAYFAWFRIVRMLPASVSGISSLAIPCVGVVSSAWMTGERITPHDLLAMALIGAALMTMLSEQMRLRPKLG
jgi:drug/metabolite transporter (DMT)-like permease